MENGKITVWINNVQEVYEDGVCYLDIARQHQRDKKYPIVLARCDGRLRELHKTVPDGCHLEF